MNKVLTMIVMLLCATTVQASDFTAWLYGEDDLVGLRLGKMVDDNVEIGILSQWYAQDEAPNILGAYGCFHFDEPVEIANPIPIEWLPEVFEAKPYLGAQVSIDFRKLIGETDGMRRSMVGPIAGIVVQEVLVIEYSYSAFSDNLDNVLDDNHSITIGLRMQF